MIMCVNDTIKLNIIVLQIAFSKEHMSTEMPCACLRVGGIITVLEEEGIQKEKVQETGMVHSITVSSANE